jgi:membrane carboxypeptidase/penicillin-binding protein PbpC
MKKYIIILLIFLTVSFLTYCFYPVITYSPNNLPKRIYLEDRNWIIITDKANKFWYKIVDNNYDLDSELIKSLIRIEDKNYYNHFWIDIFSKLWAFKNNLVNWKIVSWWSTITEQYIKNKYFKNYNRTYIQKIREWIIAIFFTIKNNKTEILNNYLNNIYFWNNIYWLNTAIKVYFNEENLGDLNNEEITILISLIHNPWIKSLEEKNFQNYFGKIKNKLLYNFERKVFNLNKQKNIDIFPHVTNNKFSTIDYDLQKFTKEILNQTIDELKDKNVTNWSVFAINPNNWEILIYQWSKDFKSKKIDWEVDVIKSYRQPGSSMKPFLYLQALENWANINDFIIDIESEYNSFKDNSSYISENYSLKEYWLVRFKKALWNSFNNASVRLAKELWLQNVYNFYKNYQFKFKYEAEHYWYSLVLWNPSIRLYDLVYSYSKLLDLEDKNKFLLYDILSDPDNRDISFWVNSILNTSIYQAVKTWTSSDFRDNLVISYHPDFVIWVWVGNNDNSSMKWVTWITWAWYIWHNIIEKAIELGYINDVEIDLPNWIKEMEYCLDKSCFRKEIIYSKENKKYFSRIMNNIYSENDLFENLSSEEIIRLEELKFYINN